VKRWLVLMSIAVLLGRFYLYSNKVDKVISKPLHNPL
jgi:hypothetical protein